MFSCVRRNACYIFAISHPFRIPLQRGRSPLCSTASPPASRWPVAWDVLRRDKQLLLFPIVSGIGCLLVLASFFIPLSVMAARGGFNGLQGPNGNVQVPWWFYVVLFAFYFCNYFVVVFCNAGLISCAIMRFNGETPTLSDGFSVAVSRLPHILAWRWSRPRSAFCSRRSKTGTRRRRPDH